MDCGLSLDRDTEQLDWFGSKEPRTSVGQLAGHFV